MQKVLCGSAAQVEEKDENKQKTLDELIADLGEATSTDEKDGTTTMRFKGGEVVTVVVTKDDKAKTIVTTTTLETDQRTITGKKIESDEGYKQDENITMENVFKGKPRSGWKGKYSEIEGTTRTTRQRFGDGREVLIKEEVKVEGDDVTVVKKISEEEVFPAVKE